MILFLVPKLISASIMMILETSSDENKNSTTKSQHWELNLMDQTYSLPKDSFDETIPTTQFIHHDNSNVDYASQTIPIYEQQSVFLEDQPNSNTDVYLVSNMNNTSFVSFSDHKEFLNYSSQHLNESNIFEWQPNYEIISKNNNLIFTSVSIPVQEDLINENQYEKEIFNLVEDSKFMNISNKNDKKHFNQNLFQQYHMNQSQNSNNVTNNSDYNGNYATKQIQTTNTITSNLDYYENLTSEQLQNSNNVTYNLDHLGYCASEQLQKTNTITSNPDYLENYTSEQVQNSNNVTNNADYNRNYATKQIKTSHSITSNPDDPGNYASEKLQNSNNITYNPENNGNYITEQIQTTNTSISNPDYDVIFPTEQYNIMKYVNVGREGLEDQLHTFINDHFKLNEQGKSQQKNEEQIINSNFEDNYYPAKYQFIQEINQNLNYDVKNPESNEFIRDCTLETTSTSFPLYNSHILQSKTLEGLTNKINEDIFMKKDVSYNNKSEVIFPYNSRKNSSLNSKNIEFEEHKSKKRSNKKNVNLKKNESKKSIKMKAQQKKKHYQKHYLQKIVNQNDEYDKKLFSARKNSKQERSKAEKYCIVYDIIEAGIEVYTRKLEEESISEMVDLRLLKQNLIKIRFDCLEVNPVIFWLDDVCNMNLIVFSYANKNLINLLNLKLNEYEMEKVKLEQFFINTNEYQSGLIKNSHFIDLNFQANETKQKNDIKTESFTKSTIYDLKSYRDCLFNLKLLIYIFLQKFVHQIFQNKKKCDLYKLYFYEYILCIHELVCIQHEKLTCYDSLIQHSKILYCVYNFQGNMKSNSFKIVFHMHKRAILMDWFLLFINTKVESILFSRIFSFPSDFIREDKVYYLYPRIIIKNRVLNRWKSKIHAFDYRIIYFWIINYTDFFGTISGVPFSKYNPLLESAIQKMQDKLTNQIT